MIPQLEPLPPVSFPKAIKMAFSKFCNCNGRSRRSEFWYFVLLNTIILITYIILGVTIRVDMDEDDKEYEDNILYYNNQKPNPLLELISSIYFLIAIGPSISLAVRRLHDIGKNSCYLFFFFLPFVGEIILIVFFATDSQIQPNEFGISPKYGNNLNIPIINDNPNPYENANQNNQNQPGIPYTNQNRPGIPYTNQNRPPIPYANQNIQNSPYENQNNPSEQINVNQQDINPDFKENSNYPSQQINKPDQSDEKYDSSQGVLLSHSNQQGNINNEPYQNFSSHQNNEQISPPKNPENFEENININPQEEGFIDQNQIYGLPPENAKIND